MKCAYVNDIALYYTCTGSPENDALVFINSLGCDLRIWDDVIPHLSDRFYVIRYDVRGHGLSDSPPGPYTIRYCSTDLALLLDHLEVARVSVIGISVGGMIALDFAASHPERINRMVFSDTAPIIGTADLWNARIDTLREHGMAHLARAILDRWFAPEYFTDHPADAAGYLNMLTRMPVVGYTATCEAIRDADLTPQVGKVSAPSLVLCGDKDPSTPPDLVRNFAAQLPNARFQLIPDAGHLPCVEQPDSFAAALNAFLREPTHG